MIVDGRPQTKNDTKLLTDEPAPIQKAVKEWIEKYLCPTQKTFFDGSSYWLKHQLQSDTGIYLTDNQFKDAMLLCGYMPKDPDEPSWHFRISRKSPALNWKAKRSGKMNCSVSISKEDVAEIYNKVRQNHGNQ